MTNEAKRKIAIIENDTEGNSKVITELGDYPYSDQGEAYVNEFNETKRLKKSVAVFQKSFVEAAGQMGILTSEGFNQKMEIGALILLVLSAFPDKVLIFQKANMNLDKTMQGKIISNFLPDKVDVKYWINYMFPNKGNQGKKPMSEIFKPLLSFFRENQSYVVGLDTLMDKLEVQTSDFMEKHK